MIQLLKPFENISLPANLQKLDEFAMEYDLLEYGVAVHHGELPVSLRNEMERRIREGKAQLVLASPTLAQGVNLPIHTIIVYGLDHGYGDRISDATFWNVVGRIGRPIPGQLARVRIETPRVFFLLDQTPLTRNAQTERARSELFQQRDRFRVNSALLDFYRKLKQLWISRKPQEDIAKLISLLAENDLSWISDEKQRGQIQNLLLTIDNQLGGILNCV